jgi:hypothetical protein
MALPAYLRPAPLERVAKLTCQIHSAVALMAVCTLQHKVVGKDKGNLNRLIS